jgi:hypothetical protein
MESDSYCSLYLFTFRLCKAVGREAQKWRHGAAEVAACRWVAVLKYDLGGVYKRHEIRASEFLSESSRVGLHVTR